MNASEAFTAYQRSMIRNSATRNWIVGVLSIVGMVLLWVTGFGFLATAGLAILVLLIIVFGSLGKLVSSFIIASLTGMFSPIIKEYVFIFFSGARTQELFALLENTSWIKLTMVIFLFTYTISYFTGSFKLVHISNSNNTSKSNAE